MFLSGCSNLGIHTTKDNYDATGLVAVIKGKTTKADKLTYTLNGKTKKVKLHNKHFAFSVPVSAQNQTVRLTVSNGKEKQSQSVTVNKIAEIADYTVFAQEYNYYSLLDGVQSDQLPLIAKDGILKYKRNNGTQMYLNVQGSNLMGVAMKGSLSDRNRKANLTKFKASLSLIAQLSGANQKAVIKHFNKQLKHLNESSKTTIKPYQSHNIEFNMDLADDAFYVYVTK